MEIDKKNWDIHKSVIDKNVMHYNKLAEEHMLIPSLSETYRDLASELRHVGLFMLELMTKVSEIKQPAKPESFLTEFDLRSQGEV